jgi:LytS/YehU family sensor histidine kinase
LSKKQEVTAFVSLQMTDVKAANRMTARLGEFLRFTLESSGTNEVPLRREVEFLESYLEIERIRFQDRLAVRLEIDPGALDVPVPSLILQPIVENAIRHGIASRTGPGQIEIRAIRHEGTLRLHVRNDGQVLHLEKERVGISNTKARLQQLYGDRYRFDMINATEGGGLVSVEIPVHQS